MTLPAVPAQRRLQHRRRLDIQVYSRDDGLWEVEAVLEDLKTRDVPMAEGLRRAGEPIHDLRLHLIIDRALNIVQAASETRWMPYDGVCNAHGDAYRQLAGLNLARGFRKGVLERVGGVRGCTHLTELAQVLPTAVIQAFAGEVIDTQGHDGNTQPFQINRCHALRSDGEAVRIHYPRWYQAAPLAAEPQKD